MLRPGEALRLGRFLVLVVAVLGSSLMLGASVASALPGPSSLTLGFVDDPAFQDPSSAVQAQWESVAQSLGSSVVRLGVGWQNIAPWNLPARFNAANPADPNYSFSNLDSAVRNAAAHHQTIILVVGHAPPWAEGANKPATEMQGSWFPNPAALGAFAHALAVRYSGRFPDPLHPGAKLPRVTLFQCWNEENLARYLSPQWYLSSTGAIVPAAPDLYRAMLNSFYAGVKSVQPRATVLMGGTAPYGDPPGGERMEPVAFWERLFCLDSRLHPFKCGNLPHFDVVDHHPYGLTPTSKARQAGNVAVPDFAKLWRVLHAAERSHHVLPAGPKAFWCTELDWSSGPPADTPALQLQFLPLGFYELWKQGIDHVFWFQLLDPVKDNSFNSGGLYYRSGLAKPAVAAYRFPFVFLHGRGGSDLVWGRAPYAGRVVIQKAVGSGWRNLFSVRTTAGGVFYATYPARRLRGHPVLRAVIGSFASPPYALSWG